MLKSGIFHYISKPFDPDQFIQIIEEILSEKKSSTSNELAILDTQFGRKSIGGSEKVYIQVLNEYFKENQNILESLSSAISKKQYIDAIQIIHKVKSSTGSIGAKSIYELCINFQKALKNKNEHEIMHLNKEFAQKFLKLLTEISDFQRSSQYATGELREDH